MQKVAVIGLGRFGMSLARHLDVNGAQVMAIDRSTALINEIKDDVDVAIRLDSTDEAALKSQELGQVDVCVIAIGENFEAALLTTVIAKKLGVGRIICRAQSAFHEEIFLRIGADEVIRPETQAGEHLGRKLANPHLIDFISLAKGFTLLELVAPAAFHQKQLQAIGLRSKYDVNLVAIKRTKTTKQEDEVVERQEVISVPKPNDVIRSDDVLVVVGSDESLAKLPKE